MDTKVPLIMDNNLGIWYEQADFPRRMNEWS